MLLIVRPQVARILGPRGLMPNPKVPPPPCLGHPIFFPVFESKRSMYTDVAAARVGRRPDGVSESHVSKPISGIWLGFLQFGPCRWDNEKFW